MVRISTDHGLNIQFQWTGPAHITQVVCNLVYVVVQIYFDKEERVHCDLSVLYKEELFHSTETENMLRFSDEMNSKYKFMNNILDNKHQDENFSFRNETAYGKKTIGLGRMKESFGIFTGHC